ncbi:DUF1328 domain-containing protein [Anatilimnocola floriformis]
MVASVLLDFVLIRKPLAPVHLRLIAKSFCASGTLFALYGLHLTDRKQHRERLAKHIFEQRRLVMLQWALTFLILALVAAAFGFFGIAGDLAWIGKVLFVVFLVLFLVGAITGGVRRPIA